MRKFFIQTFGCAMNYSDSERIETVMKNCGFQKTSDLSQADLLIANTCAVRQKSEDKAIGFFQQTQKNNPNIKIIVTGCMVRQTGTEAQCKDLLTKHRFIDAVFRIEDCAKLPKILKDLFHEKFDDEIFANFFGCGEIENYFKIFPETTNKTQVRVPIMNGCDKFCSYCIVPLTRGREISREISEIIAECRQHVLNGAKEITLVGQNVNSFTENGEKCFPKLLQEIDKLYKNGLKQLRFISPHPQDWTDETTETLANMKVRFPYLHLPAQHASDRILKKMNRHYTQQDFKSLVVKIREKLPNIQIATDLIVGFPAETEDDFEILKNFAKEMNFSFCYTAIYSPRAGTAAAKMVDEFVPLKIKQDRFHILDKIIMEKAAEIRENFIGKTLNVLVETAEKQIDGKFLCGGRSEEFFETYFLADKSLVGEFVKVKAKNRKGYILNAEML